MKGNYKINLKNWVKSNVEKVLKHGVSCDIDMDEIVDIDKDKEIMVKDSIAIFNYCCMVLDEIAAESVHFHVSIELTGECNFIQKAPVTFGELLNNIDEYCNPNFILYKPDSSPIIPMCEFYRAPVFIENIGINKKSSLF